MLLLPRAVMFVKNILFESEIMDIQARLIYSFSMNYEILEFKMFSVVDYF